VTGSVKNAKFYQCVAAKIEESAECSSTSGFQHTPCTPIYQCHLLFSEPFEVHVQFTISKNNN